MAAASADATAEAAPPVHRSTCPVCKQDTTDVEAQKVIDVAAAREKYPFLWVIYVKAAKQNNYKQSHYTSRENAESAVADTARMRHAEWKITIGVVESRDVRDCDMLDFNPKLKLPYFYDDWD